MGWQRSGMVGAALLALLAAAGTAQSTGRVAERAPLAEPFAYEQVVRSQETGRDYRVRVWAPITEAARAAGASPALFVLDGQADAGLAAALARRREAGNPANARWIVTVSPAADPVQKAFERPASWDGGDHEGFAAFLAGELLPMLRERHRFGAANLLGADAAGRAVLETLAHDPEAFSVFLADDPDIDRARIATLATAIPAQAQRSYSPKLVIAFTSAPHSVAMPLMALPQAMVAGGRRAEWHINLSGPELIEKGLSL